MLTGFTPTVYFLMAKLYHSHYSNVHYCIACICPINYSVSSSKDFAVCSLLMEAYHTDAAAGDNWSTEYFVCRKNCIM